MALKAEWRAEGRIIGGDQSGKTSSRMGKEHDLVH